MSDDCNSDSTYTVVVGVCIPGTVCVGGWCFRQGGRGSVSAHTHVREGGGVQQALRRFPSTSAYWALVLYSPPKVEDKGRAVALIPYTHLNPYNIVLSSMATAQDEHQQISLNSCVDGHRPVSFLTVTHCFRPSPPVSQSAERGCANPSFCTTMLDQEPFSDSIRYMLR